MFCILYNGPRKNFIILKFFALKTSSHSENVLNVSSVFFISGEKINLKFDVSCARPLVYEWLKQGIREDITVSPPEVSRETQPQV